MSALASACSCLCVAVAGCPEHQHRMTAALGQIDHLAEAAPDLPRPLGGGLGAGLGVGKDSYRSVPRLCLSGRRGKVVRAAVPGLRLAGGAE